MKAGSKGKNGFVVDEMLWKLGRFLRIAGFDTLMPRPTTDEELAKISMDEGRVLLTRDKDLSNRNDVISFRIREEHLVDQLKELKDGLDLGLFKRNGSRCPSCGYILRSKMKEEFGQDIPSGIPPKVFDRIDMYYVCTKCGKSYWRGKHWDGISNVLDKFDLLPDQ